MQTRQNAELEAREILQSARYLGEIQTSDLCQALKQVLNGMNVLSEPQRQQAMDRFTASEFIVNYGRGEGIALPNALIRGLSGQKVVLARVSSEVNLIGSDNKPLKLICMVLSPTIQRGRHVRTVAELHRFFQRAEGRNQIFSAISGNGSG